jgi:hypothetical protein
MGMFITPTTILRPLTRESFDNDTCKYGVIEAFDSIATGYKGIVFSELDPNSMKYTGQRFLHPELFTPLQKQNLHLHITLHLEGDGEIQVRLWKHGTEREHEPVIASAPPLCIEFVSANILWRFFEKTKQTVTCEYGVTCTGAKHRPLEKARTVLVQVRSLMGNSKEILLCRHCFQNLQETSPHLIEGFLDGGSIHPHAPVPIISGGCYFPHA